MSADPGIGWEPSAFAMHVTPEPGGGYVMSPRAQLGTYLPRLTDALEHWAAVAPERVLMAQRAPDGQWRKCTYAHALQEVRAIAAGLSRLGLSAERPLLILSGNSIEHFLLGLAAMYVGAPYCPVSPAYSLLSNDLAKLKFVFELLTPGAVAAFNTPAFERAIAQVVPAGMPLIGDASPVAGRPVRTLAQLGAAGAAAAGAARLHTLVTADSIAKFLLTSGSTGQPKAVITTQRMLCSNQHMLREAFPFVVQEAPVIVDWLPWNHTFGGSNNVGLALYNGGSFYIDDGRPIGQAFEKTVQCLREISPTIYFNVPKGLEMLAEAMAQDHGLRASFYRTLRACFFAGAGLSQRTWDALDRASSEARGVRVPILSSLGATETSPAVTSTTPATGRANVIGLPMSGCEVRIVPEAGKLELRVRGPNVTPGYWRRPELTAAAFDEAGFYRLGDAVRLVDPADPARGLVFDGRIAEDFKLASGTFVSVGPLRAALHFALAPLSQDTVIAGLNRDFVAVLIIPDLRACATFLGLQSPPADAASVLAQPRLRAALLERLHAHAQAHPGNSTRVQRASWLIEPPSLDHGEITDKGSINQRAVLAHRAALVEALYAESPPADVAVLPPPG